MTERTKAGALWIVAGAPAVPLTTIFHELTHYAVYRILGAPELRLHYASVSFTRAGIPGVALAAG